jgi:hypothetical protein
MLILTNVSFSQNYSLYFNGTNSYVDFGSSSSLNLTDSFTVDIWTKIVNVNTNYPGIIGKNSSNNLG